MPNLKKENREASISFESAREIHEEMQRIKKLYARLTPGLVLKFAKKEDNPLHPFFEWDDTEAAIKYRLKQAESLIKQVKVIIHSSPTRERVARVRTRSTTIRHTSNAKIDISSDEDDEIRTALEELDSWAKRYSHIRPLRVAAMFIRNFTRRERAKL